MQIQVKGPASLLAGIQPKIRDVVLKETANIQGCWKKTVENLLDIGHSLEKIKEMLPHPIFLAHIKASLGLGEMQASRLIALHRKFGTAGSSKVLEAKPSVLYLLATAKNLDKVEKLAGGKKVLVAGKRKSIDQLRVEDALKLREATRKPPSEPSDAEIDKDRASTAFESLGDLCQQIEDWAKDLLRFQKKNLEIKDRRLVIDTLKETRAAIGACLSAIE
jgi:hypothetical protein